MAAVREVKAALSGNRFVMRTDVKSYYASIDGLACHIKDRDIVNLPGQYMRRTAGAAGGSGTMGRAFPWAVRSAR